MVTKVSVVVPWAEDGSRVILQPASRVASLEGSTVGIVDNGWHCMRLITEALTDALVTRFGVRDVVVKHTSGSLTLEAADRADLARRCQAVILGIGTCGSCTRWVLKDAVELERSAVPTVSLYTEAFAVLAATLSKHEGMTALPIVVLPHPLNPLPDEEIRSVASAHLESIVAALLPVGLAVVA